MGRAFRQLSAHTHQKAAPVAPSCQERGIWMPQSPHVCLTVLCYWHKGRGGGRGGEEGSGGHTVSWGSRHGWCCPVCLYLHDGLQLGGWQAVQFTEILDLIWCVQEVHPRIPDVGSREYSGTDAHFCEIWLSWGSGQVSCSLSKVKS